MLSAAIIARVTESNSAAAVNARDAAIVASIPSNVAPTSRRSARRCVAIASAGQVAP